MWLRIDRDTRTRQPFEAHQYGDPEAHQNIQDQGHDWIVKFNKEFQRVDIQTPAGSVSIEITGCPALAQGNIFGMQRGHLCGESSELLLGLDVYDLRTYVWDITGPIRRCL